MSEPQSARKPRRDDVLECLVSGIDARGGRVARSLEPQPGYRVRLDAGVPGARVAARVSRRRGERVDARLTEVLAPSPDAAEPRCAHFRACGGCSLQDVRYGAQLALLRDAAEGELAPLGAAGARFAVEPVVGCDEPWRYRNKMDFTFGSRRWVEEGEAPGAPRDFALGLHARGRFDKVLDVRRCEIQLAGGDELLATARDLALARGLAPWDVRTHAGVLRHLVLRRGVHTGELLVFLVASRLDAEVRAYAAELAQRHPEVTTLVLGRNDRPAAVAQADELELVRGGGRIRERLRELLFEVSATSFFQTNTLQAERLLDVVREEARVRPGEVVLDLCCGAGTFALALARDARLVQGIEREPAAVADARANAALNGIENARFEAALLERSALTAGGLEAPDVCVVDPPRAGLHPSAAAALLALAPPRLVYVSCNARSAARDLVPFVAAGYRVERARPLDLFPHTPHVEVVLSLVRAGVGA